MPFVSCTVKEKSWLLKESWLLKKSPILTINHCHSRLEEVINYLFLIPFSISHCVRDASQMFNICVLQKNSNLGAIGWKSQKTGNDSKQCLCRSTRQKAGICKTKIWTEWTFWWVCSNCKVDRKIFSAQKWNVPDNNWIQYFRFFSLEWVKKHLFVFLLPGQLQIFTVFIET